MEDIVASFFHMLYLWTEAFLSPVSISYFDFLVHFSMPSWRFLVYTSSVLRGAPYTFNKISFTYQKKKKLYLLV
jgi:hypothetical protein